MPGLLFNPGSRAGVFKIATPVAGAGVENVGRGRAGVFKIPTPVAGAGVTGQTIGQNCRVSMPK